MRVVILGVGSAQADAIRYLKSAGHEVHGLSYRHEGAALPLVDQFAVVNISDKEGVLRYARSVGAECVYSVGSDIAMPTIGYVCRELGLPCFASEEVASLLQDKSRSREFMAQRGIGAVRFARATSEADLAGWDTFPAIVKPVDSQGQRGIQEVTDAAQLAGAFRQAKAYSATGAVIVEQYIGGNEISVNGYLAGGALKYAFVSDRRTVSGYAGGLVQGHDFPATMPDALRQQARDIVARAAQALGYTDGPLYFQMKHHQGQVHIIEGAPRFDGCHLWRLIRQRYGIDLLDIAFRHLLGQPVQFPQPVEPAAERHCLDFFVEPPGQPFDAAKYQPLQAGAQHFELYYAQGETIRPVNGKMDKVGYRITTVPLNQQPTCGA